ncbi:MAG: SemiSWEET transporter [Thermodesulfobacteriota bacterium]
MEFSWTTILGLVAAACTTASFLPQVGKTLKTRKTEDISLLMYAVLTVGIFLWLLYGFATKDLPIIVANTISLALAGTVLALKVKHG